MLGEWRGAFLAEYQPPIPGHPTSVACNFDWSITRQTNGRFSGDYRLHPGQASFFPLQNCNRTGSVSGAVSTRGVVSDLRFDPAPGVSNDCVTLSPAALEGQMNNDQFTALGNDQVRCEYGVGPVSTPRALRVDTTKSR